MSLLTDEVWRQLDPTAGRLPRRTVLRLRRAIAVTLTVAVLAGLAWQSGLVVPRLDWSRSSGYAYQINPSWFEYVLSLTNRGWTPVEVVGAGHSGPGLRLDEVRGAFPTTLAIGATMSLVLRFTVTDCAVVPKVAWPVPVTVRRPWGAATVDVQPEPVLPPSAPDGFREYSGRDPYALEWQDALAQQACHPAV